MSLRECSSVAVEHAKHHIDKERDNERFSSGTTICPEPEHRAGHKLAYTICSYNPAQELGTDMRINLQGRYIVSS